MIRLIEATSGSGKTCIAVEWLLREIERGFYGQYYSNISGLNITGVRKAPDDWREINPEDADKDANVKPALLIIDEAQYIEHYMKENRKTSNPIGKALSTHRHHAIDIWFITQNASMLNNYVLGNVNEHVYLYRPRKRQKVKVYWWSHYQANKSASALKSADDEQSWYLNKNMYQYYKSTSAVTDGEVRKSSKLTSVLITAFIVFLILGYVVYKGFGSFNKMRGADNPAVASEVAEENNQPNIVDVVNSKPLFDEANAEGIEPVDDFQLPVTSMTDNIEGSIVTPPPSYTPSYNSAPVSVPSYNPVQKSTPSSNTSAPTPVVSDIEEIDDIAIEPPVRGSDSHVMVDTGTKSKSGDISPIVFNDSNSPVKRVANSSFVLSRGTAIPCVLKTAINSTYSGNVSCQVSRDIYSFNGSVLLIERGSMVYGEQATQLRQGQARVGIIWDNIKTPNGLSIDLKSFASDNLGRAGLSADVQSHFWKRFTGAVLFSVVKDVLENAGDNSGVEGAGDTAGVMVGQIANDMVNIPPTATVNHGVILNVVTSQDIDFSNVFKLKRNI